MDKLISLEEALSIVLSNTIEKGSHPIEFQKALGCVLAEPLYADRPLPPFDRVTMDGIAISFDAFNVDHKSFVIESIAPAGAPQKVLTQNEACIEVMTGAVLPKGTDTVIRYEDLMIENGIATIDVDQIKQFQNVHATSTDRNSGDLLIPSGTIISPAEIGIAATIGKSTLEVKKWPKAVVISTGDELVEVAETPAAHQIRRSNVYTLVATLKEVGIEADELHLTDDEDALLIQMKPILEHYDLIILSGGVSKGKYDFLPKVFEQLGVEKKFHGVLQRPGKPFWFGTTNTSVVFALPGNPVSSYMCTNRYVKPWLRKTLGLPDSKQPFAILATDYTFKPDLTYLLQVAISYNDKGQILATPVTGKGSGDLANLADADAFLELPRGQTIFEKGTSFPLFIYRR